MSAGKLLIFTLEILDSVTCLILTPRPFLATSSVGGYSVYFIFLSAVTLRSRLINVSDIVSYNSCIIGEKYQHQVREDFVRNDV